MNKLQFSLLPDELKKHLTLRRNTQAISRGAMVAILGLVPIALIPVAPEGATPYVLTLTGVCTSIVGSLMAASGGTCLALGSTGEKIDVRETFYNKHVLWRLRESIAAADWQGLNAIERRSGTAPICLRTFVSESKTFAAALILEYVPYEYKPLDTPTLAFDDSARTFAAALSCR